jgi:hypothetical protein
MNIMNDIFGHYLGSMSCWNTENKASGGWSILIVNRTVGVSSANMHTWKMRKNTLNFVTFHGRPYQVHVLSSSSHYTKKDKVLQIATTSVFSFLYNN